MNLIATYKKLPFTNIKSQKILRRLYGKPKHVKILADIFDDDIYSSKISFWINGFIFLMIVLSTIEVILSSDKQFNGYNRIFEGIPVGAVEKGLNHFCYALYDNLPANYSSRGVRIYDDNNKLVLSNITDYYKDYQKNVQKNHGPELLIQFLDDLVLGNLINGTTGIQKDDWVFVICSGASGRGYDIIVEYGKKIDSPENDFENSTIHDIETFLKWKKSFLELKKNEILTPNKALKSFDFVYAEHKIGNPDDKWIGKALHRLTGANVVTIYININILIGNSEDYYAMLHFLMHSLESTFGSKNKNEEQ